MITNVLRNAIDYIETKSFQVWSKSDEKDLVTTSDVELQRYLSEQLQKLYPESQIVGEEDPLSLQSLHKDLWIIDPIDGTTNFVKQQFNYGVLCAHVIDKEVVEAYLVDVSQKDIYWALKGKGVFVNHKRLISTHDKTLKESLLVCNGTAAVYHPSILPIFKQCYGMRYLGSASLDCLEVIRGHCSVAIGQKAEMWDLAPMILFAKELNLKCVNMDGTTRQYTDRGSYVFGSPKVVDEVLEVIHHHHDYQMNR